MYTLELWVCQFSIAQPFGQNCSAIGLVGRTTPHSEGFGNRQGGRSAATSTDL
jgi:hypothetical protein